MAEEMHVAPAAEASDDELLTGIIRELIAEIHPPAAGLPVFLDSRLAADLGLDSLAVVELRSRLEEASGVVLPDGILTGETPREWLDALRAARGRAGRHVSATCGPVPGPTPVPAAPAPGGLPTGAETLLDALAWHAQAQPARTCIRVLEFTGEESAAREITYAGLSVGARAVAAGLRQGGLGPGEAVAIMLPTGPELFLAFMGTLAGGPVRPLGPASRAARRRPVRRRLLYAGYAWGITVADHRGGGRPGLAAGGHAAWPAGALGSAPCGGAAAAPAISRPPHRDRGDNRRRQPVRYCR